MADSLIFLLPEQPDPQQLDAHWWQVRDGALVDQGVDRSWPARAAETGGAIVALAPSGSVRFGVADRAADAGSDRQAATIARLVSIQASLGDPDALHAVAETRGEQDVATAVVDNGVMLGWLEWCRAAGADPVAIVPTGALLPSSDDWIEGQVGSDLVIGRRGTVLPGEPDLVSQVVGDASVHKLSDDEIAEAIVAASAAPPLNLRTGRFARRRRILIETGRIRELALLAAAIPLITLAWAIASVVALDRSTDRIDAETTQVAERALGRPVAIDNAEAELRQQRMNGSGFGPPVAALYRHLQSAPGVSATVLSYRRDGTLSTTLAAPTVDEVNRLLVGLQRDAYRITAVPRQSADGRTMVDVTVRGGP